MGAPDAKISPQTTPATSTSATDSGGLGVSYRFVAKIESPQHAVHWNVFAAHGSSHFQSYGRDFALYGKRRQMEEILRRGESVFRISGGTFQQTRGMVFVPFNWRI